MGGKEWSNKGWRPPRGGGQGQWGYWRGSYSASSPRGTRFPPYDGSRQAPWREPAEDSAEPQSFLQSLQSQLNQTRKAEQKVTSLGHALTKRREMWEHYTRDMKAALRKEHQRYLKDVERLQAEHQKAQVVQEEARRALLQGYHGHLAPPVSTQATDQQYGSLMDVWMQEEDGSEATAVLQRAYSAAGHRPAHPAQGPPPGLAPPPAGAAGAVPPAPPAETLHGFGGGLPDGSFPPAPKMPAFMEHLLASPSFGAADDPYMGATPADPYLPSPGNSFLKSRPASISPRARVSPYPGATGPVAPTVTIPPGAALGPSGPPLAAMDTEQDEVSTRLRQKRALEPFGGPATPKSSTSAASIPPNALFLLWFRTTTSLDILLQSLEGIHWSIRMPPETLSSGCPPRKDEEGPSP